MIDRKQKCKQKEKEIQQSHEVVRNRYRQRQKSKNTVAQTNKNTIKKRTQLSSPNISAKIDKQIHKSVSKQKFADKSKQNDKLMHKSKGIQEKQTKYQMKYKQGARNQTKLNSKLASKSATKFKNNQTQLHSQGNTNIVANTRTNNNGDTDGAQILVSPFQISNTESMSNNISKSKRNISINISLSNDKKTYGQSNEMQVVKDINYAYIQLFYHLFQGNTNFKEIHNLDHPNNNNEVKLTRDQRYQLECLKLLKRTTENINRLRQIKGINDNWSQIQQYVYSKKDLQTKVKQTQNKNKDKGVQGNIVDILIKHHQQLEEQYSIAEKQHQQLYQKSVINISRLENRQDNKLTKLEKSFKNNQRKLAKMINQQQYYEQKCAAYQQNLQLLHQKIKKSQLSKLNLEMKIIADRSRNQRSLRKAKEKRQKSLKPTLIKKQKPSEENALRSKSSIKFYMPKK